MALTHENDRSANSPEETYLYTTIREYRATEPDCTGEFIGQDGEIMGEDARITVSSDGEWCAGWYDGNQTWEDLW